MLRSALRCFSDQKRELVLSSTLNNVTTIKMNNPEKLNGWTDSMLEEVQKHISRAREDAACQVIIFTGSGSYYCAGVNLSGALKIMAPKKMLKAIEKNNQTLFEIFLNIEKPIIAAINGPAIGASVTSATLCNAIIASESATFLTPFARLGVTPEGCSSLHFPRLIGQEASDKMLQADWQPSALEAKAVGLVTRVVSPADLQSVSQQLAESWISTGALQRTAMGFTDFDKLREVNKEESKALAHAFVSEKFLKAQVDFLTLKKKDATAFRLLLATRPLWSKFL